MSKAHHDSERRRLIHRLIKKLTVNESKFNEDYITAAAKYTGLHFKVLQKLETCDVYETKIEPVDRSVILAKLVYFYLAKNKIPSTYDLFLSLHGAIPAYIDIGNFRKLLVKMDFVWKKVSAKHAVVIEKPLVRFERYNYLKRIQIHRASGADIYYIDEVSYDSNGNVRVPKLSKDFLINVLQNEWMQKVVYAFGPDGIHALQNVTEYSKNEIEEWVRDSLLPKITKPSVFVLKNADYHDGKILDTPTLDSLKSEIICWLDRHSITYDPKMSKYELFALAEKFTDLNMDLFTIDQMLIVKGHAVLRIPKCIENMTSAALLYRIVNENFSKAIEDMGLDKANCNYAIGVKSMFRDLISTAGETYFEEFEEYISKMEVEMISTEDKVDEVYDSLIIAKIASFDKDNYVDSDLPSCTDSE